MAQIELFQYDQINETDRVYIQDRTIEIQALVKRSAQDIIDIGLKLIEVKERLPHGQWGKWLDSEFGMSERMARDLMNVARRFKSASGADLNLSSKVLRLLAAPSTPDEAIDEAIDRARDGEAITHKAAKGIVASHKEKGFTVLEDDERLPGLVYNSPLFECPECDQTFNSEVWHCHFCNHHWQLNQRDCPNCYKDKLNEKEITDMKRIKRDAPQVFEQVMTGEIATMAEANKKAARLKTPAPAITPPLPDGKFRCIVIDPPWPMKKIERKERPDQGVELDYPIMSLDEIKALPINDFAYNDGCHLYLWVTQKYLPFGLELVKEWGFNYQCLMTWRKNVGITPFSWMYDTEHVIFAKIGSLPLNQLGLRLSFDAKVNGHSVKPDTFFDDRVLLASPAPRIEMFARQKREGFTAWGNEV